MDRFRTPKMSPGPPMQEIDELKRFLFQTIEKLNLMCSEYDRKINELEQMIKNNK